MIIVLCFYYYSNSFHVVLFGYSIITLAASAPNLVPNALPRGLHAQLLQRLDLEDLDEALLHGDVHVELVVKPAGPAERQLDVDAAATTTREVNVSPSTSVRSRLTKRCLTSPLSLLRLGAMELSLSMKSMARTRPSSPTSRQKTRPDRPLPETPKEEAGRQGQHHNPGVGAKDIDGGEHQHV